MLPKAPSPWKSRSRLAGSCSRWKGACEGPHSKATPGLGAPAGDYWTCSQVDFTAASLSCGPPSLPRCRPLHPELAECSRRPSDLGQQAAILDSRTPQGHRRALRPPPPQVWRVMTELHAKAPSTDFATLCSLAKGTHLAMFDRSRCFCTSSRTSRKKRRRFSSNCWHCSNTCSMLSMYCGVPWPSSFRDFSYFSLLYDRPGARMKTRFHSAHLPLTDSERAWFCTTLSTSGSSYPSSRSDSISS